MFRTLIYILSLSLFGSFSCALLMAEPNYPLVDMQLRGPDPEPWSDDIQEYTLDMLAEVFKNPKASHQILIHINDEQKLYMMLTLQELVTGKKTKAAAEMARRFAGPPSELKKIAGEVLSFYSQPPSKPFNPLAELKKDPLNGLIPKRDPKSLTFPEFHSSFEKSVDSKTKIDHIYATQIHAHKDHLPFLYKIAMNKTEAPDVRIEAIYGIAVLQGEASIPFLRSILNDKSDWNEVRAAVIGSKSWLSKEAFSKEVKEIASGPVTMDALYGTAIWALGFDPKPENLKRLSLLALDPATPYDLRSFSIQGLELLKSPEGMKVFNQILASPDLYYPEESVLALNALADATRANRRLPASRDGLFWVLSRLNSVEVATALPSLWEAMDPKMRMSLTPYDRFKIGEVPSLLPLNYAMNFSSFTGVPLDQKEIENHFLALPDNILKASRPSERFSHLFGLGLIAPGVSYKLSPKMEHRLASQLSDLGLDPKHGLNTAEATAVENLYQSSQINGDAASNFVSGVYEGIRKQPISEKTARQAINDLVETIPNWTGEEIMSQPDKHFPLSAQNSWESALKEMSTLFLLKARSVNPKAKKMADKMVKGLLESRTLAPAPRSAQSSEDTLNEMKRHLKEIGHPELLANLDAAAERDQNRVVNGTYSSPTILYQHQYRNLVLKEILRSYPLKPEERRWLETKLEENEKELTKMLSGYETAYNSGETETFSGNSNFNTYALSTMALTAKNPDKAQKRLDVLGLKEHAPYSPDPRHSVRSARASAARDIPFRLAILEHAKTPEAKLTATKKLDTAVDNYLLYLPDLILHSRRSNTHLGADGMAPYYLHPTIPYLTSSIEILMESVDISGERKNELLGYKPTIEKMLLSQQLPDGTFATPDQMGQYTGSAGWVNPLMGLALLPLVEGYKDDGARFGILTPD